MFKKIIEKQVLTKLCDRISILEDKVLDLKQMIKEYSDSFSPDPLIDAFNSCSQEWSRLNENLTNGSKIVLQMTTELKGVISMARAALAERKQMDRDKTESKKEQN